jgi:class 3 adenylate cyclase
VDSQGLNSEKTVLEVDLVGYHRGAVNMQEHTDVRGVELYENINRELINSGLSRLGLNRDEVVLGEAGDNAIIVLNDAESAHSLARLIYEATVEFNQARSIESAKRYFRMGAATGDLLFYKSERRIIGTVIARAVRLEAAAEKGQLVIDSRTFQKLSPGLKKYYGEEEVIKSKNGERYKAHRCSLFCPSGDAQSWFAQIQYVIRPLRHHHY